MYSGPALDSGNIWRSVTSLVNMRHRVTSTGAERFSNFSSSNSTLLSGMWNYVFKQLWSRHETSLLVIWVVEERMIKSQHWNFFLIWKNRQLLLPCHTQERYGEELICVFSFTCPKTTVVLNVSSKKGFFVTIQKIFNLISSRWMENARVCRECGWEI